MIDFKVLAQPSAIQTGDTRDNVYYPQIVNLSPLNTRGLIQAMMNMGSTAFSMGEYLGVASDLGGAIAQMMISGHKINLEGLGTFTPKIETTQKNVKEASAVNSSNFSCTVVFTPADEFLSILRTAIWNRVQSVDPGQSSTNAFTVAISSPAGNTLKLLASKAGALANFPAAGESITIDGVAPDASNIRYDAASGAVYIYNVAAGKHNVAITVGTSRGFEAYDHTWQNVAVADAATMLQCRLENEFEDDLFTIKAPNTAALEYQDYAKFGVYSDTPVELTIYNKEDKLAQAVLAFELDSGETSGSTIDGVQYKDPKTNQWVNFPVAGWRKADGYPSKVSTKIEVRTNKVGTFALKPFSVEDGGGLEG